MYCAGVGAGRNVASADAVLDLLASAVPKQTSTSIDPIPLADLAVQSNGESSGRVSSSTGTSSMGTSSDDSSEGWGVSGDAAAVGRDGTGADVSSSEASVSLSDGSVSGHTARWREHSNGSDCGSGSSEVLGEQLRQEARDLLLTTLQEQQL